MRCFLNLRCSTPLLHCTTINFAQFVRKRIFLLETAKTVAAISSPRLQYRFVWDTNWQVLSALESIASQTRETLYITCCFLEREYSEHKESSRTAHIQKRHADLEEKLFLGIKACPRWKSKKKKFPGILLICWRRLKKRWRGCYFTSTGG